MEEYGIGTKFMILVIGLIFAMIVSAILTGLPWIGFIFTIICLLCMLALLLMGICIFLYVVYWLISSWLYMLS